MPECRQTRAVDLPLSAIWSFVQDMDNWAPMMKGYVGHEKQSESESIWTLKGDLGPFSKTVKIAVIINEWKDAESIAFELAGIGEAVKGSGSFQLSESAPPPPPEPPAKGWWASFLDWILGRKPGPLALPDERTSHVVFNFTIEAQGPMGPMINALLGPWADEVASELLQSVGDHLEGKREQAA